MWWQPGLKMGIVFTVTGNSFPVTVSNLGSYQVEVTDDNGCANESAIVTITGKGSTSLYVYPNPTPGQFTVSYYNSGGASTKQSVTIYDSRGAKVYKKEFTFSGFYELHSIDLTTQQRGIYFIVIGDATGKKIAEGKVLIH